MELKKLVAYPQAVLMLPKGFEDAARGGGGGGGVPAIHAKRSCRAP